MFTSESLTDPPLNHLPTTLIWITDDSDELWLSLHLNYHFSMFTVNFQTLISALMFSCFLFLFIMTPDTLSLIMTFTLTNTKLNRILFWFKFPLTVTPLNAFAVSYFWWNKYSGSTFYSKASSTEVKMFCLCSLTCWF